MNVSPSGGGNSANVWGFDGSGAFGLIPNTLGAEVDGGYHNTSVSGVSADLWDVGGSVFWGGFPGRAGATVSYNSASGNAFGIAANGNVTTYGAFLEYYFGDQLTAGVKGGGVSLNGSASGGGFSGSGSTTGSYFGGGLTGYIIPDLALSGNITYASVEGGHVTNYFVGAEYLFSEMIPLSLSAGYMNTEISGGGGSANSFLVALTFYTSGNGITLRDHHREGTLGWIGNSGLQTMF